jgi:hypothetical protein
MQAARHLIILLFVPTVLMTIFVIESILLTGIVLMILIGLIVVIFRKKP